MADGTKTEADTTTKASETDTKKASAKSDVFVNTWKDNSLVKQDQNAPKQNNQNKKRRKSIRRKQGGARHHKKWKPYNKLSWKEKKELEDFESERACMKRAERFAEGHPVAPYNTTQFLMEEHNKTENISPALRDVQDRMDAEERLHPRQHLTDEYYDSPNDEDSFIAKDFSETYDSIHAQHIETMSKTELVRDYMELEMKVEKLEEKLKVYETIDGSRPSQELKLSRLDPKILGFFDQKLKTENERLRKENAELRKQVELLKSEQQEEA